MEKPGGVGLATKHHWLSFILDVREILWCLDQCVVFDGKALVSIKNRNKNKHKKIHLKKNSKNKKLAGVSSSLRDHLKTCRSTTAIRFYKYLVEFSSRKMPIQLARFLILCLPGPDIDWSLLRAQARAKCTLLTVSWRSMRFLYFPP